MLPSKSKDKGGVLTPAIAFGHSLVDRLKTHGFRFEVAAFRGKPQNSRLAFEDLNHRF